MPDAGAATDRVLLVLIALILGLAEAALQSTLSASAGLPHATTWAGPMVQAAALASLVGFAELISRYKDAPLTAVLTPAGLVYILVQASAASAVYQLIHNGNVVAADGAKNRALTEVLTAAFGTAAFLRSAFFTVRMDGKDIGLGPALLWQTLLDATDRAVDRARAAPRSDIIRAIMAGIDFDRAAAALPEFCFHLMQNVSSDERKSMATQVAELRAADMDPLAKTFNLGLNLLNVVGERVLREAVWALGAQIKGPASASIAVIAGLRRVSFASDAGTLAQACLTISASNAMQRDELDRRVQAIAKTSLKDDEKLLLLAIELLNLFGDGVVSAALKFFSTPAVVAAPAGGHG